MPRNARRLQPFSVHEEVALEHAIVELALFVGKFAVAALKIGVRGKDVDLPAVGQLVHRAAEGTVELARLLALEKALAVRRVGQDDGAGARGKVFYVCHLKAAAIPHPGQLGVGVGQRHSVGVNIKAKALEPGIQAASAFWRSSAQTAAGTKS